MNRLFFILVAVLGMSTAVWSQSQAALDKLLGRYSAEQVEEMQLRAHYKYEGLLLFYSSSFLVLDNGVYRSATEAEIAAVDLDQYIGARAELEDVVVHDADLANDILLRSRQHFEQLVLGQLSADDRAAYLAYRASSGTDNAKGQR
ncbi:MAG: hypothetical protein ABI432_16595 [Flavobacteriales bacterium]